jgi:hypothetical protein
MSILTEEFKNWCGFPNLQGAIDGTHISIVKPPSNIEDYYYHKTSEYNVVAQVVVHWNKRFIYVFVGILRIVNDSRVLHRFVLYKNA